MLIRLVWPNCKYRNKSQDADPRHSFWVEATLDEAQRDVFPRLSDDCIAESHSCEERSRDLIASSCHDGNKLYPYCFLVAQDLSSIDPFHASYPFDNLWNGYSPFENIPESTIDNLEQLKGLILPEATRESVPSIDSEAENSLSEELRYFVAKEPWTYAKTYAATYPHEYIVEEKVDRNLYSKLAHHIDTYGYTDYFYNKAVIYLDYDGYTYWHMENIINRCVEADTYHRRKQDGRLPETNQR